MPTTPGNIKTLKQKMQTTAGIQAGAFYTDEEKIQTQLAGKLRAAVTHNLRYKKGDVAKNFMAHYVQDPKDPIKAIRQTKTANDYVKYMSKDKSWGGMTEVQVLGEMLGVNIRIQPYDKLGHKTSKPYTAFSAGKNAPTLHLNNHAGVHWSARGKKTTGDGNCLFNACAQALQQIIKPSLPPQKNMLQRAIDYIQQSLKNRLSTQAVKVKQEPQIQVNHSTHDDSKTKPISSDTSGKVEENDWEYLNARSDFEITERHAPPSYESIVLDNKQQKINDSLEVQSNLRQKIKEVPDIDKPFYENILKKEEDKLSALLTLDKQAVKQTIVAQPPSEKQKAKKPPSPEEIKRIQKSLMGQTKTSPKDIERIQKSLMGKTKNIPKKSIETNQTGSTLKHALHKLKHEELSNQENQDKNTQDRGPTPRM
ncbi:MAG: hypothetical protein P1U36_00355 [Legionellaceae bacterium]|nr:hypothetical protein [Legionellaceae bacterium]